MRALRVTARYWSDKKQQWVYIAFDSVEDSEEFECDTGIVLHNLTVKEL